MYSNSAITYDKEAELAYIYVIPPINQPSTVELTEDLEVNENISLDINKQNLIVGMEIFGELANDISKLAGSKKIYKKTVRNKKKFIALDCMIWKHQIRLNLMGFYSVLLMIIMKSF